MLANEGDTVEPGTKIAVISKSAEGAAHVAPSGKVVEKSSPEPSPPIKVEDKQKPKAEPAPVIEKPKTSTPAPPTRSTTEPQLPPKDRETRVCTPVGFCIDSSI